LGAGDWLQVAGGRSEVSAVGVVRAVEVMKSVEIDMGWSEKEGRRNQKSKSRKRKQKTESRKQKRLTGRRTDG
jgi:hypothetical protein